MSRTPPRTVALTGASGFLGNSLCRSLLAQGHRVRALVLPNDPMPALGGLPIERISGDLTCPEDLDALLQGLGPDDALIHAASIVSLAWRPYPELIELNVSGTAAVIEAARRHAIGRLIYVSSIHALPNPPPGQRAVEIARFEPAKVIGGYAQTKASATELVLQAAREGLDAVVVQPTGLLGPGDPGPGAQTQMIMDVLSGRMNLTVEGGHDYADVRDVASGVVAALTRGRAGECYLLTGRYLTMQAMVDRICEVSGRRPIKRVLNPRWLIPITVVLEPLFAARRRWPSLTRYSLYTLGTDIHYDHAKATAELGYQPRDPLLALDDAVKFLMSGGFAAAMTDTAVWPESAAS